MERTAFYACDYIDGENNLPANKQFGYCYQKLEGTEFEFAGYYSDRRYISSNRRRNGLMKLLKDAQDGMFERVQVNDIHRLAMDHNNLVEVVRRLKECGVEVYLNLGKAVPLSVQLADDIRRAEEEQMFAAAQEWEAREDTAFENYVHHQESGRQSSFERAATGVENSAPPSMPPVQPNTPHGDLSL